MRFKPRDTITNNLLSFLHKLTVFLHESHTSNRKPYPLVGANNAVSTKLYLYLDIIAYLAITSPSLSISITHAFPYYAICTYFPIPFLNCCPVMVNMMMRGGETKNQKA